ncbi:protein trachealess-like isoform X3 [Ornithodoros turicata]|uniref:protein trachealess-like isoform X3 n=1 Tax=Ornithodoros turicata TaxID=34597 RepID=UPI003138C406
MQHHHPMADGYGALPMDLHVSSQGYHPYFRYLDSSMVMKAGGDDGTGAAVVQSRILEMRKEKSRDAARSRRGKENYEFYELAKMLPLPAAITSQLDKASIIRLTISYLKLRDFSQHGDRPWSRDLPPTSSQSSKALKGPLRGRSMANFAMDIFEQHQGTHILQSLDGFTFALAADGRFLYISETVSIYLGLSQVEMTGSSVFDYIHQQDHAELAEQLGINLSQSLSSPSGGSGGSDDGSSTPNSLDRPAPVMTLGASAAYKGLERSFCIRMKSTLTKRGCHFKSSGYRVVLVLCHLRPQYAFSPSRSNKQPPNLMGMVAMAIALPPPSVNEVRLESDMFVMRLTFDFRVAHCEPRISELLDYTPEDITGRNMYSLCHGQDVQKLRKCHVDLMNKGQVMSSYYRLMNKNGGYTWVQTCATVICNNKNSEEQSIICVNYVISSGIEYENCIMDSSQLRGASDVKPDDPNNSERGSTPDNDGRDDHSPRDPEPRPSPKSHETHSLGGQDGTASADHLTQLGTVNKVEALRSSAKIRGSRAMDSNYAPVNCNTYIDPYQDVVCSVTDPSPAPIPKNLRKRPAEDGNCRSSPKSRPGSRSSLQPLQPSSPARSLPSSDQPSAPGFLHRDEDRGAGSCSPPGACDDSCDGPDGLSRPWKAGGGSSNQNSTEASSLTVRELEDAMKKHLPESRGLIGGPSPPQRPSAATIQWIGGPQTTGTAGPPPPLPASTLLRQLYVSRESVIRSGSHVSGSSRPTYYGDVPTPPEGPWGAADAFMLPGKDGTPYGVLPYPGYVDAPPPPFSAVTPPSSVSPRDSKLGLAESPAFSEAAAAAAAAAMPHMRHYVAAAAAELPLKPQVLVHPGGLDYATQQEQQLYTSGFHLYGKPNGGWYAQQPNS